MKELRQVSPSGANMRKLLLRYPVGICHYSNFPVDTTSGIQAGITK